MIRRVAIPVYLKLKGEYFRSQYRKILEIIEKNELDAFVEEQLRHLIMHSYKNVPYYKELFSQVGLIENNQINLERFKDLPYLTKDIIRLRFNDLLSRDYKLRGYYYNTSGGSTGEPVRFVQDKEYRRWVRATVQFFYKNMLGFDYFKVKEVIIWGAERDIWELKSRLRGRLIGWFTRRRMLNAFKMTPQDMLNFVKVINKFEPDVIRGYATALYEFSRFIEKNNLEVHSPKFVITTAETLLDFMRKKIEDVWGAEVRDFYGSRETAALGGECEKKSLHFFIFNQYVEIVESSNRNGSKVGELIVTTLHNYSMPLIRYKIGDMVEFSSMDCSCGLNLPKVDRILGRLQDNFILKDGTIVYGDFFAHLFYFQDWVKRFQVIQEDYDKIRIIIVPNEDKFKESFPNAKKIIEDKIRIVMGDDVKIEWEFVEDLPKPQSGKYIYAKSLLYNKIK